MSADRTKQVTARVNPDKWEKFLNLCSSQGISGSEALAKYVDVAIEGLIPDLYWGQGLAVNPLLERIEQLEKRLIKLEAKQDEG